MYVLCGDAVGCLSTKTGAGPGEPETGILFWRRILVEYRRIG